MIGRAPFGATGHDSSRVIFGAAALGSVSKADADRTLDVLPRLLDAAERFEGRPSDEEMAALAARAQAEPLFV